MILFILLIVLAVWGSVATVRAVRRDGLRRVPSASIARPASGRR